MRRGRRGGSPMLIYILIRLLFFAAIVPALLLFDYSEQLGYWWSILMALYIGLFMFAGLALRWRREMDEFRRLLGDEQFFAQFPGELKREKRRKAWEKRVKAWKARLKKPKQPKYPWEG